MGVPLTVLHNDGGVVSAVNPPGEFLSALPAPRPSYATRAPTRPKNYAEQQTEYDPSLSPPFFLSASIGNWQSVAA